MYKLEYLPVALKDLIEIMHYISHELQNPDAARRLSLELTGGAERILEFPYSCPPYIPIRPLRHEYRKLVVENYLILYWVDDIKQVVTIARVIYAKRDCNKILKGIDG